MSDRAVSAPQPSTPESSPFDALVGASFSSSAPGAEFTTAFRGYDRDEVDRAIARLTAQVRAEGERVAELTERQRHAGAADAQARATVERLQRDLAAAQARVVTAEGRIEALTDELVGATADSPSRPQFEEILRVAEEQASVLVRNASTQGERLLVAAREEVQNRRTQAQAEADAVLAQAEHDAAQVRLRIDTELTAHQALIERETAHAAEKVAQAEQEAAAVRAESEKGAAALRSMVARETTHARAEAEEAVRELRVRALEFEESLTRRQNDAQQEFLVLHNQAVAHSERITQDANDQVAASLEHAQRVAAKADDFERLMRAQAAQIEADANIRARETLERARDKAQKIIDMVSTHSQSVLRDAEDRTRHLRWQQHQLTSFMSEVKELIRPLTGSDASALPAAVDEPIELEVIADGDPEQGASIEASAADPDAEQGEHAA